ncbi:ABC transporter ATP-binding protein [Compostimonas suwonensis]|uniref:Putative ABC transport system ATP-binding protein n=1 Tax=Compostimonas suwonensis TaxID=1048394 RepID=A0A2M9BVF8_9MICO|nr:ABC transporter ATP-binding protein [Compostimonas suwonensis]PJJ61928.1 putative ABC transport system ATP-binding protein [Compostimonas suwonensis]
MATFSHNGGGLIEAESLSKVFDSAKGSAPVTVLRDVSLRVDPGEMVAIVGPSGSGKSTLLYCLAGLEPATSGTVSLFGRDLAALRRNALAKLRRDAIGFVFQAYNLIPSLTAAENAGLPGRLARRRGAASAARESMRAVGLSERGGFLPGRLSGGQQQRVAIARVLASGASLVFADEPTGALDTRTGEQVLSLLRDAASGERSVVLVTHDLEAAARADRVLVLRDGLIHSELIAPTAEDVLEAVRAAGEGASAA